MALEFLPEGVMFDAIRDMIRFTGVDGVRFVKCGVTSGALMDVGLGANMPPQRTCSMSI